MIKKYSEKLNKDDLGCNRKVNENKEIMNYFKLKSGSYCQEANGEVLESEVDKSEYHPSIRYHEYSFEEIEKNKHIIQWNHFSGNEFINWNFDLIFRYKDYLWFGIQKDTETYTTDGLELYNNESVPWDLKLIQLFADKVLIHREVVKHFMFNETMVKKIKPQLDQEMFSIILNDLRY